MFCARVSLLLVLQFYVIHFFVYLFLLFYFFTDSSEPHLFIHSRHSRSFAVQFERNHVLSTKKTLKITVKVFFYILPDILY